ncbi:hypothetical protein [Salinirubrum litoreum]|uniref:Uncharacterized protein n=1 Tax=Salinirubrum litoreum TaxID=1126234 RepID=A0ABD5R7F2_9EURY|nr:hypothetical protein [Salinirubrum litoreum]
MFSLAPGSVVDLFGSGPGLWSGPWLLGVPLGLGPIDALIDVFGPFVIPVLLFAVGIVGYLLLLALGRAGIIGRGD